MRKILIFIGLNIFFNLNFIVAQNFQNTFEEANRAYEARNFDQAIQKYELILGGGIRDAAVYLNLGNAYAQRQQLGRARVNLERGLRLEPHHSALLQSLDFVQKSIIDDVPTIAQGGFSRVFQNICWWGGTFIWKNLGLLSLYLGVLGLVFWLVAPSRLWKKRGLIGAIGALPLSLIFFGWSYGAFWLETRDNQAVVMISKTIFRLAPEESGAEIQHLNEGIKVETKENMGAFTKIKLPNQVEGWVLTTSLERI